MNNLVLYATSNCHLCEQAQRIIYTTLGAYVQEIDIVDDERLVENYGLRIPVLRCAETGVEIDWPFDGKDIRLLVET